MSEEAFKELDEAVQGYFKAATGEPVVEWLLVAGQIPADAESAPTVRMVESGAPFWRASGLVQEANRIQDYRGSAQ